jgi:hypothetical protein
MKKLVTLMLALSLGGSQVFAAASPFNTNQGLGNGLFGGTPATQTQPAQNLTAANKVFGGAVIALLLYLAAPRGENSLIEKVSQAITSFMSGRSTPADCASHVVDHFTNQVKAAGADILSSVGTSVLTEAQRLQARQLAQRNFWNPEQVEEYAAQLVRQQEHAKIAPMFAVFQQLFGQPQAAQQQSAIDIFLQTGSAAAAQSVIGR